ncbi:hypothetical protein Tco_0053035 [Tanacetum coccineum]
MADAKLARRVSMSSLTDSIHSGGSGTAAGGSGGDGNTNGGSDGNTDGKGAVSRSLYYMMKECDVWLRRMMTDYSSALQPNGKDSSVKSRAIIGLLKHRAHAAMKEIQRGMGFALNTLTQLAQAVTSKNDSLAIRVSVQNDQTAQNHLAMFRRIKGAD